MKTRRFAAAALVMPALVVMALLPGPGSATNESLAFTAPVQLEAHAPIGTELGSGQRQPSGEPSIKVDQKGIIYVAGVSSVAQASPLWVSIDGGKSFSELATPEQVREHSPYGAEGDIAIDSQRHVYFADTAIPTTAFSRWTPSDTPGEQPTWDYTLPHGIGVHPGVDDRPWLAYGADTDGTESIWMYLNQVGYVAIYRTADGGITWENRLIDTVAHEVMIAAPRDSAETLYGFGRCEGYVVLCARSTHNGGATWIKTQVAKTDKGRESGSIFVADAVDAAGSVYGVWSEADFDDGTGGDTKADNGCDIYYSFSSDGGRTWSKKRQIDGRKGCSAFPWVTGGDKGRIAVAWYETSAQGPNENTVPAKAAWYVKAALITGADRPSPSITTGTADANPVHVGPLERNLWDYFQIATGPDGRFHIAYVEDVDAGPDGYAGTNTGGNNAMDTMYVAQAGGPLLTAPAAASVPKKGGKPAPRVKGTKRTARNKGTLANTGVGTGWGFAFIAIAAVLALVRWTRLRGSR
jgi:hypothetical protein